MAEGAVDALVGLSCSGKMEKVGVYFLAEGKKENIFFTTGALHCRKTANSLAKKATPDWAP
jgi:hypothetical protein